MLPSELDAELYGILEAKAYFEEKHPSIDFNKHLLEYVNNVERWYGPNPLKGDRPVFTSFEEVVAYLYANLEIAYDYPVPIEYDGFDSKLESIRVANLDSGAEQFYLIARDLYRKKFVNEITLDATKELTDYYSKDTDRETGNEKDTKCFENEVNKEETVDDVLLSTSVPSFKQPPASKQGLSIPITTMDKQTPFVDFLDVDK